MFRFWAGFLSSAVMLVATAIAGYDSWESIAERRIAHELATDLALPDEVIQQIENSTSGSEALNRFVESVSRSEKPSAVMETAPAALSSMLGDETDYIAGQTYKLTAAEIPFMLTDIGGDKIRFRLNGRMKYLDVTESEWLPEPANSCYITLISTSVPYQETGMSQSGSARVSLKCN